MIPRPPLRSLLVLPALSLAAALAGCSSPPLPAPEGWDRSPARITRSLSAAGPLRAGAARVSLDPPYAVPMGGYFGGSEFLLREQRDPLGARAVVLEAGGLRVALVGLDLVLIPPQLRPAVESRPEFREARIDAWAIFAAHDHKAPGAYVESWAAQRFGMGTYDPLVFRFVAERSALAVARAAQTLRPVAVGSGSAAPRPDEPPLSWNRKIRGAPVDPTVRAVGLWPLEDGRPARAPLARLISFAAHPTMIPAGLRLASADYPGVMERALEKDGSVALFMNGPSGDVAAGIHEGESRASWERRLEWMGGRLAAMVGQALAAGPSPAPGPALLAYSEGEILLPPRHPWRVPLIGETIARNYPDRVRARALRVGDLAMVFFPGEMGSDLGARVREDVLALFGSRPPRGSTESVSKNRPAAGVRRPSGAEEGEAACRGWRGGGSASPTIKETQSLSNSFSGSESAAPPASWVVTLSDDYLGYVFSREQYRAGGMSQHLTIYGEDLGSLLIERLREIARPCFPGSPAATPAAEPAGRP